MGTGAVKEGWVQAHNWRKCHYVKESRSLCGGWLYLGEIWASDQEAVPNPKFDCVRCIKKLDSLGEVGT